MRLRKIGYLWILFFLFFSFFIVDSAMAEETAVVHAILFYSPSCPHCHKVLTEELPPLFEQYRDQLQIFGIDTTSQLGRELYQTAVGVFEIPQERIGVPTLIVGDTVLVGSYEIPEYFPEIIVEGLKQGGTPWPDIPGLQQALEEAAAQATAQAAVTATSTAKPTITSSPTEKATVHVTSTAQVEQVSTAELTNTPTVTEMPAATNTPSPTNKSTEAPILGTITFDSSGMTVAEKFKRDLAGNILSVFVLVGMIVVVIWVGVGLIHPKKSSIKLPNWLIPLLSLLGLVVAGYLSFVEVTRTEAVCGPVGDCNTVQQSRYARLFGILPIGVLGMGGYVAILLVWFGQHFGPKPYRKLAAVLVWGFTLFGTLFSVYLTFLEPFVIGATCAWCLSSAVIITLQLIVATNSLLRLG